jgi:hypothetical protein
MLSNNSKQQQIAQQLKAAAMAMGAVAINGAILAQAADYAAADWRPQQQTTEETK